ncbi:MAG: Ribose transport system permease protein RbsC [Firmicutes bacterium ADurb.Bin467]|jgi:ribose transport system permease protein|nr:MAG: Ribose transport system permease protein RbsC [Firmicutes bacterium ADurb.Bin467]
MTEKKNSPVSFIRQNLVLVGIVALVVVTSIVQPKFLGATNLTNVMRQLWPLPFVALGMTFVIIGGFIDLSVVGIISLCSVITMYMINPLGQVGAMLLGILAGAVLGYLNGFILTTFGAQIQAEVLFITYGMSSIYMAVGLLFTNAETMRIERSLKPYGIFTELGSGTIFGIIPTVLVVFLALLVLMHLFHTRTLVGRSISLMGGNREAAFLSGFNVKNGMRLVYTISGIMSAMGAISLVARTTIASATIGVGYETTAILCVVVGGTTLKGGKGSVLRTMFGVVLITLLGNCMNMLNLSTYMQTVMRGAVLVVAIWLDNRREL